MCQGLLRKQRSLNPRGLLKFCASAVCLRFPCLFFNPCLHPHSQHLVLLLLLFYYYYYSFPVNDPFVMKAWAKTYPENKHVKFLADGSATYTHALGLELDLQEKGLGTRSRRFALLVDDLKVKAANIEGGGEFTVSSADDILKDL